MDRLERIISQVKAGKITEERAMQLLQRDAEREPRFEYETLFESDGYSESPLDLIIKRETQEEQQELIKQLFSELTDIERKVIWYCHGRDMRIRKVSAILNVPKSTIHDILVSSLEKLKNSSDKITKNNCILWEDLFYKRINIDGPSRTRSLGMPFELLQRVNIGGCWKNHSGREVWVSRSRCLLNKYYENSFGDTNTICTICKNKRCFDDKA